MRVKLEFDLDGEIRLILFPDDPREEHLLRFCNQRYFLGQITTTGYFATEEVEKYTFKSRPPE